MRRGLIYILLKSIKYDVLCRFSIILIFFQIARCIMFYGLKNANYPFNTREKKKIYKIIRIKFYLIHFVHDNSSNNFFFKLYT